MKKTFIVILAFSAFFTFFSCSSTKKAETSEDSSYSEKDSEAESGDEEKVDVSFMIAEPQISKTEPTFSYNTYKVQRKDDYHKIAYKIYKVRHLWPCIYAANVENYPDPDLIRYNTEIKVPVITSVSKESDNIKAAMFKSYKAYTDLAASAKSSSKKRKCKDRAVGVLVSAELLIPGFISGNPKSFDKQDVADAKAILRKKFGYKI